jgi:hypothetical protein
MLTADAKQWNYMLDKGEFLIYQTDDGNTKINVKVVEETVWLAQADMASLFGTTPQNITQHINNVYESNELSTLATCKNFLQVQKEGNRNVNRSITHYNLDMIISVGYRVNSISAIHFRQWATKILREYLIKGFVLDDERLKEKNNNYFDELLERIRDIRSSEKVFYRKILEIYATSIDYDPTTKATQDFFATVQNKMHWATHGHTASELIFERANADKDFMGLTVIKGKITKNEVKVAKNYLNGEELSILNRIVNMYLDFAELQAIKRAPMHMDDWIKKLDEFLKIADRNLLRDKGTISKLEAEEKALKELDKYRERILNNELSEVEKHFLDNLEKESKKIKKTLKK